MAEVTCIACGSPSVIKKGIDRNVKSTKQRYKCTDCGQAMSVLVSIDSDIIINDYMDMALYRKDAKRTYVITSAVNDTEVNLNFVKTLELYCTHNDAQLLVIPIKYHRGKLLEETKLVWDEHISKYLYSSNEKLLPGLKVLGGLHVSPAIVNPLSGFEGFSKGDSVIIGHPQLMLKSVPVSHTDAAAILTTTGAVTVPIYTETKQGEKAAFNHSFSALVVEEDSTCFHVRVLNSDESGEFYDLKQHYTPNGVDMTTSIPGIVLGDLHIEHLDPLVYDATYGDDGMISYLCPEKIVVEDVLDAYSISHHHQKSVFTQYAKYNSGKNKVLDELHKTVSFMVENTPQGSETIVVSSNHNSHLLKWLNECNPKVEPWNALEYHKLMVAMLERTEMGVSGAVYPNPFELWANIHYDCNNIQFLSGAESFKIMDIECAYHGDKGVSGSRGSIKQFSELGSKTITGHSHQAGILRGAYAVGHSCYSKLEYNLGAPSAWTQAHCLIQPNGKRQLIFINGGEWHRK